MDILEEIEKLEYLISTVETIISELEDYGYFEDRIAGFEDDLKSFNERLEELETMQSKEYRAELAYMNREYERAVI